MTYLQARRKCFHGASRGFSLYHAQLLLFCRTAGRIPVIKNKTKILNEQYGKTAENTITEGIQYSGMCFIPVRSRKCGSKG